MTEVRQRLAYEPWTLADLESLPDDGNRYEIVDGSLLMSPAPPTDHQSVASKLIALLDAATPSGLRVTHGVGLLVEGEGETQYLIPDVLVVDHAVKGMQAYMPAQVHLVVEVVSPSSVTRDKVTKRNVYARLGIPNYWIVETTGPGRVTVLTLDETETYAEVQTVTGTQEFVAERPFAVRVAMDALLA